MQSHHVTHARMGIWSPAAVLHPCRALQMSICCYTRVTCTRAQTATLIQQVLRWKERLKKTITSGTFWSLVHTRYSNGFMLLKEQHHCTTMALQATHSDAKCFCHYPQLTVSSNREAWEIFARPSDRHSFIKTKLPVRCLAHAPPRIEYLHTVYNKFKILKFTKYSLHSQRKNEYKQVKHCINLILALSFAALVCCGEQVMQSKMTASYEYCFLKDLQQALTGGRA